MRGMPGNHTFIQRKCACGSQCPKCKEKTHATTGLTVSQSDDHTEREADRVATEVTRNPTSSLSRPISRMSARTRVSTKAEGNNLESSEVSSDTEAQLNNSVGGGRTLPVPLRDFFETRLNHDFSKVRIHTDQAAANTSQDLNAAAFTFGSDVFFNAGHFNPNTATGMGLIAHELTHVAQQPADSLSRKTIQRANLPYHQLAWGDFSGPVPQTRSAEGAGIWSSFGVPSSANFNPSVKETKTKCNVQNPAKGERKKDVFWEGTGRIDPAQFDSDFQPYMDTAQSWVLADIKDDGVAYCARQVARCEADFDRDSRSNITLGTARATSKADCRRGFKTACLSDRKKESDRLLGHEQWHFEITKVMSEKARSSFKTAAGAINITSRECGPRAAMEKLESDVIQPRSDLVAQGQQWLTLKNTVQDEYDLRTTHGTNARKQREWEGKIQAGLADYGITSASVTNPGTTNTPPTNPPTQNPPTQNTQTPNQPTPPTRQPNR